MASKMYTARELLRLRKVSAGQELYDRLLEKLHSDNGLSEVVRMPSSGALPLIQEEDAEASAVPPLPENDPVKSVDPRQLDGTDSEWKYRGRTDSEEDSGHPMCGPAGLAAQRDEGFQRFYKAVVSPTHVRVTAGGRIVPNTRGSSSPTAKWSKDRAAGDGSISGRGTARDLPDTGPFPIPQAPFGGFPSMFPGFIPSMPAGHPLQMMPWQLGMNMGNAFGMLHPHMAAMAGSAAGSSASAGSMKSDKQSEYANSENTSVRNSQDRFDLGRSSLYNGQWMMHPGAGLFPLGMPPVASYQVPQNMHPRYGMHPMMQLHAMRPDPTLNAHSASLQSVPPFAGTSSPLVSSIRQSEITKRQLENLRSHLRYLEDQLQYNKHQIDERLVEQQTQMLRLQIQLFEKNYEAQLALEGGYSGKADKNKESTSSTSSCGAFKPDSTTASDLRITLDAQSVRSTEESQPQASVVDRQKITGRSADLLQNSPNTSKPLPLKSALDKPRPVENTRKVSSIPVSAALAPPFQPRVESAPATESAGSSFSAPSLAGEEALCKSATAPKDTGKPYLVGVLPRGFGASSSTNIEYAYNRDLTEDELRARQMYWGNARRTLRKGYPKFDGKDFYPPSPVKEGSPESVEVTSGSNPQPRGIPGGDVQANSNLASAESDPFASFNLRNQKLLRNSLTQSESTPKLEMPITFSTTVRKQSPHKGTPQAGRSYEDFRKVMADNERLLAGCNDKSTSDSGDDTSILFKGRRSTQQKCGTLDTTGIGSRLAHEVSRPRNTNEILQNMLKKGKSSGAAIPGTVSSMTAQGLLPHYAGHATASLAPTFANTTSCPKASSNKAAASGASTRDIPQREKVENCPPANTGAKSPQRRAGY